MVKMSDDSFKKLFRHIMNMRQLTNVELVNTYWEHAHEINKTGRLAFIIRGNVSWESEYSEGVSSNNLWLKSNRYEPRGKHIAEEPVRTYLQWYMNTYEIWGTLAIDIDPNDASTSKPLIEQAMEKATCITNTMSFLFGASLRWFPALYTLIRHEPMPPPLKRTLTESWDCTPLPLSMDERTSIIVKDEHITDKLLHLVNRVERLPPAIQTVIKTSIDWHAHANRFASGINRFVNYWGSIELLGNFFYKRLPINVTHRMSEEEKKDMIINTLKNGITRNNCMDIVQRCNEIRMPTARTKILAYLGFITDRDKMEKMLFEPDDKTGKSLYQIRNDIAHGRLSEHHFEKVESFIHRESDAKKISFEVILLSIKCAEKIVQQLTESGG